MEDRVKLLMADWRHVQAKRKRTHSSGRAQGVDDLKPSEVTFVFRDNQTIVRFSHCGNDHIERAPGSPSRSTFRHQPRPDQAGLFIEREYPAREQRRWAFRAGKPTLQFPPFLSSRLLQDSTADLCKGQAGDEQILVGLPAHPGNQRFRWRRFSGIADDVGVEEVAAHKSTSRSPAIGRWRSSSAPTSGEPRSALKMPPLFGGSPETVRRTSARIRAESGLSPASRFASDRIRSRSARRARTSKRAIPRLRRRFR